VCLIFHWNSLNLTGSYIQISFFLNLTFIRGSVTVSRFHHALAPRFGTLALRLGVTFSSRLIQLSDANKSFFYFILQVVDFLSPSSQALFPTSFIVVVLLLLFLRLLVPVAF